MKADLKKNSVEMCSCSLNVACLENLQLCCTITLTMLVNCSDKIVSACFESEMCCDITLVPYY